MRQPVRERVRSKFIKAAVKRGKKAEDAEQLFLDVERESPIFQLLLKLGLDALVKFLLSLLDDDDEEVGGGDPDDGGSS